MPQQLRAWSVFGEMGLSGLGNVVRQLTTFHQAGAGAAGMLGGLQGGALLAAGGIAALGVGVAAWAADGVRNFARFDDAMTSSLAIMGDISDNMRGEMEVAAREMAMTYRVSATQAAEAFYFLASAGLDAQQSVAALPAVTQFATAGQFNLARATELLADAHAALGLRSKDATENLQSMVRVSDVLVKANTLANASVEQFSLALSNKAAARMRQLNIEVEEGVAILAAYAEQGAKGQLAGERLSIVLRDLPRVAVRNAQAFRDAGIEVFDTSGNMRNMADIAQDLEDSFAGLTPKQKTQRLAQLQMNEQLADGITALIGMSGRLREFQNGLREAGGTTEDVANRQMESISAKFDVLVNKVTDADYAFGSFAQGGIHLVLDGLNSLADEMNEAITWFDKLAAGAREDLNQIAEDMGLAEDAAMTYEEALRRVNDQMEQEKMNSRGAFMGGANWISDLVGGWVRDDTELEKAQEMVYGDAEAWRETQDFYRQFQQELTSEAEGGATARAQAEKYNAEQAAKWAKERLMLEAELGLRSKETLLQLLRERLDAQEDYSEEWKGTQRDIFRVEQQINAERQREQEELDRKSKALAEDWLQYNLEAGNTTRQARIDVINGLLQATEEGSREQLELFQERAKLLRAQEDFEDQWLQYRIQAGEVAKEERIRQINEEVQAVIAVQGTGSAQELELLQERDTLISQMTQERIRQARTLARENIAAAQAVLLAWRGSLSQMGSLTPAIEEEIQGAVTEIGEKAESQMAVINDELQSAAEGLGRGIVQGIINGSLNMQDLLKSVLASMLTSIITKVGMTALGIASPSRVTMGWGRNLMEGLEIGFEEQAGHASRALTRVSSQVMESAAGPLNRGLPVPDLAMTTPLAGAAQGMSTRMRQTAEQAEMQGLGGGLALRVPVENLPKALTPFETARDAQWLEVFAQTAAVWGHSGGGLPRRHR